MAICFSALGIDWHQWHRNPADRLPTMTDREYSQNWILLGDYSVNHTHSVCTRGSELPIRPTLTGALLKKERESSETNGH